MSKNAFSPRATRSLCNAYCVARQEEFYETLRYFASELANVVVLGDRLAIDLAGSTFHGYRRQDLTISPSTKLASHDLQRCACIVSAMPRL